MKPSFLIVGTCQSTVTFLETSGFQGIKAPDQEPFAQIRHRNAILLEAAESLEATGSAGRSELGRGRHAAPSLSPA